MWKPGIGSLAHFTAGLIAGALAQLVPGATIALTILFIFYQLLDYWDEGGGKRETVEYTVGLITGLVIETAIYTIL